jgi:gliding motility-associated-like protein
MLSSRRLFTRIFYYLLIFCTSNAAFCQNYVFAQLSGAPINTTGWYFVGDARPTNFIGSTDSELLVCPAVMMSSGGIFYEQPINLSMCNQWIAEFDFRMFDGTGADGLTFCFLDVPPVGLVTGGGLGIPNTANGLKVCFDTWNNCIPFDTGTVHMDMPKIEIRWGIGYDNESGPAADQIGNGECNSQPTRDNSDGKISFIRSPNYNHAKITFDSGTIKVFVNDTFYLSGYHQFDFAGYLGFTASTGGYTDNHTIKNVIIYTKMPPSFAGNSQSFCPHDTIRLGGPNNPMYNYGWNPSIGLSDTSVSAPFLHLLNDSDNYQLHKYFVRTSFNNNVGCASIDSVIVKVYPNPKVHFITPEICVTDADAQFYDSTYTADSTTLPFSYLWNFGDPYAQSGNPNNSTLQNPTHHYSAARNYTVALTVTNSPGCIDSAYKIFTVNGDMPFAGFQLDSAAGLCSSQTVQITNTSTVNFGSIIRVQIFWGDTAATYYTDSFPYPGKVYAHNYPNPVSSSLAEYTIRMISFSGITCQNEQDLQITIQPSPHLQFSAIPPLCAYDPPLNISQATELTTLPGSFSFYGSGISSQGILSPQKVSPGIDDLICRFTATNGCSDTAYQTVYIQAPPLVHAGNDTSVVINQPLQLRATSSDPAGDSFVWSPATGLDNPNIPNPIALLESNTDSYRYIVRATDTLGCYAQASVLVKVFSTTPSIFVPNAFTPGNAINNIFRPIAVGISSLQFFRIYNRWGQLVYSSSRLGDGWDGSISGQPQETGSYVWMVQGTSYTGQIISKQGTMTLIR